MFLESVKNICRHNPQSVIFAEANDKNMIRAARCLLDQKLAHPILFGGGVELRDLAGKINVSTKGLKIVNPNHSSEIEPYVNALIRKTRNIKISRSEAISIISEPINNALMRLVGGNADLAIAGNQSSIAKVISAGLKYLDIRNDYKRLSSFYLLISKDAKQIFAFADCSVNINPNPAQLAEIAIKTAENFKQICGRQPRVAFLSFSTKGSSNHKKVEVVQAAYEIFSRQNNEIVCDGELQFDAAVDQMISQKKAPNSSLFGNTNVFIFPSLNAANIAHKIAVQIGGFMAIGPMIQGFKNPLHAIAKCNTVEEIINSVLLASFMKTKSI